MLDPFFGSSRELAAGQGAVPRTSFNDEFPACSKPSWFRRCWNQSERRRALEDQRAQLELNLALFKEYQPAVDEAALAQARLVTL